MKVFIRYLRWSFFCLVVGAMAGAAAAAFLYALDWATYFRDQKPALIYFLPLAGLFIGWTYHRFRNVAGGTNLILDEIHDPKKIVPIYMAPLILLSTVLTHLFGGSAGREGTAVQMGASLADQLSHLFPMEKGERKILLVAGAGAGFGAAIGAPWAGALFGMEVIAIGRLRPFAWFECLVASFAAYYMTLALHAPHSKYPLPEIPAFTVSAAITVIVAGVIFGLAALLFARGTHLVEKILAKVSPVVRPALGGIVLVGLFHWEGTFRYVGLGIPVIQEALLQPASFHDSLFKALFTALTLGAGFKGGEFIPLVFIGATLGSALAVILPLPFSLLGALGFAAVFGGAANTPIACTLMAMEIFGFGIWPFALLACFASYFSSGHKGIYSRQKIDRNKFSFLRKIR